MLYDWYRSTMSRLKRHQFYGESKLRVGRSGSGFNQQHIINGLHTYRPEWQKVEGEL